MDGKRIEALRARFEAAAHETEGVEFWYARELQHLLAYTAWHNFLKVVEKARKACVNSGEDEEDHFHGAVKKVRLGSGSEREIEEVMLTRYACYLVAQNGDPRKEEIAFAQSYFAVQTRKQEILEERMRLNERLKARKKLTAAEKELSELIYQRGVDSGGFARIRSKGDQTLFGGLPTSQMKDRLEVPQKRSLADFLPTVTVAAKYFATQLTNFNVKEKDLRGEKPIADQHVSSNADVRETMLRQGIKPEELPAEEDIKKVERRLGSEGKQLLKGEKKGKK